MTTKEFSVRMSAQGGERMKAELVQIGNAGQQAFQKIGGASGAAKANLMNASFQVQDFFVQVSGGTSPSRALAQQLPQLLGSMGLVGVLAGTAAAALIPLFASMSKGKDDAELLTEQLGVLKQAISDLRTADRGANSTLVDLTQTYGAQAEKARELLQIERDIAAAQAQRAFGQASGAWFGAVAETAGGSTGMLSEMGSGDLTKQAALVAQAREEYAKLTSQIEAFGSVQTEADQAAWDALQNRRIAVELVMRDTIQYRDAVGSLAAAFGVSEAAAAQLAVAAARVREADNTEDRVEAARELAKQIWESTDGLTNASDETRALYGHLLDAVKSGLELEALDIAATIGAGADEARILAANLGMAYNEFVALTGLYSRLTAGSDERGSQRSTVRGANTRMPEQPWMDKAKGGRSSGGGGGVNDDRREAQRIYEQTRTEAEKYEAELAKINALHQSGALDADTYQRALAMVAKKYGETGDMGDFFTQNMKDLKSEILDLAVSGEASFDRIADAIKRAALEALFFGEGPLAALFGGAGGKGPMAGGISGLLSELFGGKRAAGGPVNAGTAYLVGERGPEIFAPGRNGMILPNSALGGGGGGTTVQIIDQRGGGAPVTTQRKRGPDGREMIIMTVRDATATGELDGSQRRFGVRPEMVKR